MVLTSNGTEINGWCTDEQYAEFMKQVNEWEASFPVKIIKFWLSISEEEQGNRLSERKHSPLKFWKLSPNDERALSYYDEMTLLKEKVLTTTDNWYTINYNDKREGRLALITKLCDILENEIEKLLDFLPFNLYNIRINKTKQRKKYGRRS